MQSVTIEIQDDALDAIDTIAQYEGLTILEVVNDLMRLAMLLYDIIDFENIEQERTQIQYWREILSQLEETRKQRYGNNNHGD